MQKPISLKTFNRLVDMLTIIEQSPPGQQTFSSNELGRNLGVSDILVRKDLNSIGISGRPQQVC